MQDFILFIKDIVGELSYFSIFIMMVIESSFVPFPSEIAMIPAWFLISTGQMSFLLALTAWTAWALIWATINYYIAFKLWEKILVRAVRKYGKYVFLTEKHYMKAENYFANHGTITVFLARFIPAVRQLISLPAWAFEMNFAKFFFYTWLWAGIWNLVLIIIGYIAWENKELISKYLTEWMIFWIIFIVLVSLIYYFVKKRNNENKSVKK